MFQTVLLLALVCQHCIYTVLYIAFMNVAETTATPVASTAASGCPKCGTLASGKSSCCGAGGAWFGKCGSKGNDKFAHTWGEGRQACQHATSSLVTSTRTAICPKCGINKSRRRSCCALGGAWFGKCGSQVNDKHEYTWLEGIRACESGSEYAPMPPSHV